MSADEISGTLNGIFRTLMKCAELFCYPIMCFSYHFFKQGEDPVDWKSFFTFSQYPDYQDLLDILHLTKAEIRQYGHQYEDFVLECTYDEASCNRQYVITFFT